MKKIIHTFSILFILFLTGCSSTGFNRGALQKQLSVKSPVVNDAEIAKALKLKPNLPRPFKVGVYFAPPKGHYNQQDWRWETKDKEIFLEIPKELKNTELISEVFQISQATMIGDDLQSIRLAAAKHGADAVLVITGTADVDRYNNSLGFTYILLVTAFFIPGSEVDALFMTNATLWDVRNEYLYLTAEAEAIVHKTYIPAFGKQNKELFSEAKSEVLKMAQGIKK